MNLRRISFLAVSAAFCASGAGIRGIVLDPSRAAIAGAEVSAVGRTGIVARAYTDQAGAFELRVAAPAKIIVTAPGFETRTVEASETEIVLRIAAQVDSVRVVGSTMDVPLSEQGGSAAVIPREEIASRNEPLAADLLRYLPGVALTQAGARGAATSLFIRGGDYNFNLVQIDGVPVNAFGGAFDFAHIPTDWLDRVELIRGPQSAVYGSYANSGAVNLVTRPASETPALDLLAEGGTYQERRFAAGTAGVLKGFGISAFASRMDSDGPVANSGYRNENVAASLDRVFARQAFNLHARFTSNDAGAPGPWGSDPARLFTGIDTYSRNRNNSSNYLARYHADLTPRVRQELTGAFFLNNNYFSYPYGDSFNQDMRGQAEARTLVSVTGWYTTSFGFAWTREREKNSWITDSGSRWFPLRRDQEGLYWENRLQLGRRLFVNAGARAEVITTGALAANADFARPFIPEHTVTKLNPKLAAAYVLGGTRLHGSFGTGIRPPAGFDLAFTNNPELRPERTASFDFGVEQRLLTNRLSLDATYFHNRFSDLIVSLGGSLARLSSYRSANLANSRAQGVELAARVQAARRLSFQAAYTYLDSAILSLDGSAGLAPAYFRVGQPLLRRPAHSGTLVAAWQRGRAGANLTGYWRGETLDTEPNFGASSGLFPNPGYFNLGFNLNVRVARGLTAYGSLRNALNQRYEEVLGYPSPLLNFVTGLKFTFERGR
ncbi:MAG: TonB-dependent receptor [Bryobacteraceae bacterium]